MFDGLFNFLADFANWFLLKIDSVVYSLIGWLYEIYMLICRARIFRTETFQIFINRIYVILGVVMLFFLAYSILTNIVDPDNFAKGESSMGKIISNTIISLVLIAVLPTIFNFLYYSQNIILEQDFLGKLILGKYSDVSNELEITFDDETCQKFNDTAEAGNNSSCTKRFPSKEDQENEDIKDNYIDLAGNSIAVDIFSSFYYPSLGDKDSETSDDGNAAYNQDFNYSELEDDGKDFDKTNDGELYKKVASYDPCHTTEEGYVYGRAARECALDIKAIFADKDAEDLPLDYKSILQYSKSTGDFDGFTLLSASVNAGKVKYTWIISTIAGLFVCYIMVSYCIDMGLRAVKLGFTQLIAPVPILARIIPKQASMFNRWISFTLKAYFEVFLRILIIFLGIFMITHLPTLEGLWEGSDFARVSIMSLKVPLILDINSASWGTKMMARVAIIIGILTFVKQAPSLIEEALGININAGSLSVRDKLKNMAGAGIMSTAIGAATGWQGKGWQFGKQGQQAFKDTTGSDYNGSYLPWSRNNSIGGRINRSLDTNEQRLKVSNKQHYEDVVKEFEKTKDQNGNPTEFANRISRKINESYSQQIQEARQAATIAKQNAGQEYEAAYQAAQTEKNNVQNRINSFENSQEYADIKAKATRNAMREAQDALRKENKGFTSAEVAEKARDYYNKYLKEELDNSMSNNVKQYVKDTSRNIEQETTQAINKAKAEAKASIDKANNSLDAAMDKITADAKKDVVNEIKQRPRNRKEAEYANAVSAVKRLGDEDSIKELRKAISGLNNDK